MYHGVFDLDSGVVSNDCFTYQANLVEPDGIFKLDFVRFAYRYKFDNNQYSPLGPFSEVAFKAFWRIRMGKR